MRLGLFLDLVGGGGVGWTPSQLGSSLLGWWDSERSDLITQSGGLVSSWKDAVAGYDAVQVSASLKPSYSVSSFNSRPGITFDGVDDNLRVASQPFPSGANASEIWGLVDQQQAVGIAGTLRILAYGGTTNNDSRFAARAVAAGVNAVNISSGTGAASTSTVSNPIGTAFSGRHVARVTVSPTTLHAEIDGGSGSSDQAAVSATGTSEVRIAAGTNGAGFWLGVMNTLIVTGPLTADQAAQLYTYLKARGGIA